MSRKFTILFIVLGLGLALDLMTKIMVLRLMPLGSQIPFTSFFNLVHVHNVTGAQIPPLDLFYKWVQDHLPAAFIRWFFIITTSLALGGVGYLWWRLPPDCWQAALGYSLIMAGGLGNLADRVRLNVVVDFLDFYWGSYHWPAFNVADSMLCIGVGLLLWVILRGERW
jgi:signal peptidase II